MTNEKKLHKVDDKSRAIKKESKGLFKMLPFDVTEKILGQLDFDDKKKFRAASNRTKEIVDQEQFNEFKRYQNNDPELLRSVVHFVDNGFAPPVLHSIIDVHGTLLRLQTGRRVRRLCDQLIALQATFYRQAKCHFDWDSFKLLSTLTIVEMLMVTTNQRFTIVSDKPTMLRVQLMTLYNHDNGRLAQCGGDIVKFISELSVIQKTRYGQTPQPIILSMKSSPSVIAAFKAFFSNEKFHVETSDHLEATFYFPAGKLQQSLNFSSQLNRLFVRPQLKL